ncbi:MAG: 1-(5-phosphoribosyl)-5-[(5-phosphoribosylamino)methylideneamino]imidazole-4-carboxamide isomerase [Candidatus Nitronauta litoralis]|uniref:1-(5-phosphoribosyl)-5-[(5-phosphoribosylamino)methylideneamino] imidazole-4-carboxamide isomerase n=1 Tax=Candidatus Nitronauta litoralis TaxID=2705533 RepID=A0A7T0G023_9BACT|nr:MAG: 1-(5-phosphoribosyl)-5-[(5-phosphoribosylamino)methylideneamino]imidazole-4-carboxamide isomerase [Candidatus Nitronauta litoralis]
MKVIPAVDIKGGKCVRLVQGQADRETVYGDDPVAMAVHWDEEGAQLIHIVDLDGAFDGLPRNAEIIKNIIYSSTVDIQVGGGIRTMEALDGYFMAGAYRCILGTIALKEPAFVEQAAKKYPGKIMVGIDAKEGMVAVKGWVEVSEKKASDLAKQMESCGAAGFIFTDIGRDGMMQGPNLDAVRAFCESTSLPVIASGGVTRLEDITAISELAECGVEGMIVGKALYDKSFQLKDALKLAKDHAG